MSLNDTLINFRNGLDKVNEYINLAFEIDSEENLIRSNDEIEFIISSAFLKMFIEWEGYLESAFIQYLVGESSISGDNITKYASPIDVSHAHKMIIGSQSYIGWANNEIVKKLAKLYFENGEPFSTPLDSIARDLSDLRVIRNAAAHISTTTQHKLDAVASRKLGRQVSDIGVAEFITNISPEDNSKTILQMYMLILDITAENIANNRI